MDIDRDIRSRSFPYAGRIDRLIELVPKYIERAKFLERNALWYANNAKNSDKHPEYKVLIKEINDMIEYTRFYSPSVFINQGIDFYKAPSK